jgi:hypothetical protein
MWMIVANNNKNIEMNYIIRQECFDRELSMLLNKLQLSNVKTAPRHCLHNKISKDYEHLTHYTALSLYIIEKLYHKDFTIFLYNKLLTHKV